MHQCSSTLYTTQVYVGSNFAYSPADLDATCVECCKCISQYNNTCTQCEIFEEHTYMPICLWDSVFLLLLTFFVYIHEPMHIPHIVFSTFWCGMFASWPQDICHVRTTYVTRVCIQTTLFVRCCTYCACSTCPPHPQIKHPDQTQKECW